MKKQRKANRLKRKHLKAAFNALYEENLQLRRGWRPVYREKEIRKFANCKEFTIVGAEIDQMLESTKDIMAAEIGKTLKDNGAIQFEVIEDPVNCGIIVDANVKVVMP